MISKMHGYGAYHPHIRENGFLSIISCFQIELHKYNMEEILMNYNKKCGRTHQHRLSHHKIMKDGRVLTVANHLQAPARMYIVPIIFLYCWHNKIMVTTKQHRLIIAEMRIQ